MNHWLYKKEIYEVLLNNYKLFNKKENCNDLKNFIKEVCNSIAYELVCIKPMSYPFITLNELDKTIFVKTRKLRTTDLNPQEYIKEITSEIIRDIRFNILTKNIKKEELIKEIKISFNSMHCNNNIKRRWIYTNPIIASHITKKINTKIYIDKNFPTNQILLGQLSDNSYFYCPYFPIISIDKRVDGTSYNITRSAKFLSEEGKLNYKLLKVDF